MYMYVYLRLVTERVMVHVYVCILTFGDREGNSVLFDPSNIGDS